MMQKIYIVFRYMSLLKKKKTSQKCVNDCVHKMLQNAPKYTSCTKLNTSKRR